MRPDGSEVQSNLPDRLWTVVEAAQYLNLTPGSLYHLISQQRIPVIRISARCVRFSRRALLDWVEHLTSSPVAADSIRVSGRKKESAQ
jgi:excisionase family DNA binding protein